METKKYEVYYKHKNYMRAKPDGVITDSYERAIAYAQLLRKSWEGQNGVFEWLKIKDLSTGKYIDTFFC